MGDNPAHDLSRYRLEKSADDLETARIDFEAGKYNAAVNRAYYSFFHAIRAVLALDGVDFKKHSAVISYFNKEYIATGYFEKGYYLEVKNASAMRNSGDYDDFYIANREDTERIIIRAADFHQAVSEHIYIRITQESAAQTQTLI